MSANTAVVIPLESSGLLVERRRIELPGEILLIIFTMARDSMYYYLGDGTMRLLNNITHVCRRWRHIAIHAPLLWTTPALSLDWPNWTLAVLERVASQPLHMELCLGRKKNLPVLKALLARISRTVTSELRGTRHELAEAQQLASMDDASILQSLTVWSSKQPSPETQPFVLLPTTFRNTHRLRELLLTGVGVGFDSPLLCNLTTLSLRDIPLGPEHTWTAIRDMLNALPLLEYLTLRHALPSSWTPTERTTPLHGFAFQHLRHLQVECITALQMNFFLLLVRFPMAQRVKLEWHDDEMGAHDHGTMFGVIAERLYAKQTGPLVRDLIVAKIEPDAPRIEFTASGGYHLETVVVVPNGAADIADAQIVTDYLDMLCLTHLESFSTRYLPKYGREALHEIAQRLPLVKELSLSGTDGWGFIRLLDADMEPAATSSEPTTLQPVFPKLESIIWRLVDFVNTPAFIDEVAVPVLLRRQDRGVGLRRLALHYVFNLPRDKDALLAKVAADVDIIRGDEDP